MRNVEMMMFLPPELLGKVHFEDGKLVFIDENAIHSEKEVKLLEEYNNKIEESKKHRYD